MKPEALVHLSTAPKYPKLTRTPVDLDAALYCASCFAASASDGSRTVTILCAIAGREELYRIEDGRVGAYRDNATGLDWGVCYIVEAPDRR